MLTENAENLVDKMRTKLNPLYSGVNERDQYGQQSGRDERDGRFIRNTTQIAFIIEGKVESNPGRGRPRRECIKEIMLNIRKNIVYEIKGSRYG